MGFESRLRLQPAFRERAIGLARALAGIPGTKLVPEVPQTNLFHFHIHADRERLKRAVEDYSKQTGFWLGNVFFETENPGWCFTEITCGEQTLKVEDTPIRTAFESVIAGAT
jgi:hypothetical protein